MFAAMKGDTVGMNWPAAKPLFPRSCLQQGSQSKITTMKSAYELAMERLEKKAPTVALTPEQKAQIAEIDSTFKARIAERELFLKGEINKAQNAGNLEEAESLQKQLTVDLRRFQEDAEAKKEKLRASFSA
jgi:hypothetical protein